MTDFDGAELSSKAGYSIVGIDMAFIILAIVGYFLDKRRVLVLEQKYFADEIKARHSKIS